MRDAFSKVTLTHSKMDDEGWVVMRLETGT